MQHSFGEILTRTPIETPYGEPTIPIETRVIDDVEFLFITRHGYQHEILAHRVNYRANIWALRELGATKIIAGATVGGIDPAMKNGDIVILDQIIDYTSDRETNFELGEREDHFDFTYPFEPNLRDFLLDTVGETDLPFHRSGTYGCAQGPRFETAAEIKRMARDGCTVVGMTLMPEAALARQIKLDYAAFSLVVNPAAGIVSEKIEVTDLAEISAQAAPGLSSWFSLILKRLNEILKRGR